jgi:hypothetical protein
MALKKIGKFVLRNGGGFTARAMVSWTDKEGKKHRTENPGIRGDIVLSQEGEINPGAYGVPAGAQVAFFAFVSLGDDVEARQLFEYDPNSNVIATYSITGTFKKVFGIGGPILGLVSVE